MDSLEGKKVLMLVHDDFEQSELVQPMDRLREAGAEVVIASDVEDTVTGRNHLEEGDSFDVDIALEDVDVDEFDALVVPGGVVNADMLRTIDDAKRIATTFDEAGKPMAVICHGPWLLVSANLVDGRTLTSYYTLEDDILNAGGEWVNREVVIDGNLLTSRNPKDLEAFSSALISMMQQVYA